MKFVGNPDLLPKADVVVGDAHYKHDVNKAESSSNIPEIDFGPTYSLNPDGKRPGTSGTMTQVLHDTGNSFSRSRENLTPSPNELKRQSYISGRTTPIAAAHMRSSSASPLAPDSRTIAWQPSMSPQTHSDKPKFDAEEWVQQRAAAAFQPRTSPVHAHGRNKSHTPGCFITLDESPKHIQSSLLQML